METFDIYQEPVRAILLQIGAFLPRLVIAVAVVMAGWLVAILARLAVKRGLKAVNLNILSERSGLDGFLKKGGLEVDTLTIFAALSYWLVILASLLIALNGLGLTYITELLSRIVWFVPNLFVALLVLAFGSYFARVVDDTVAAYCRNIKVEGAAFLGKLARSAVMVFVVLIALDQVKVGGDIVRQSFLIILAGCVFAISLAFGLGARGWAADRVEQWWPRDHKEAATADRQPPR